MEGEGEKRVRWGKRVTPILYPKSLGSLASGWLPGETQGYWNFFLKKSCSKKTEVESLTGQLIKNFKIRFLFNFPRVFPGNQTLTKEPVHRL